MASGSGLGAVFLSLLGELLGEGGKQALINVPTQSLIQSLIEPFRGGGLVLPTGYKFANALTRLLARLVEVPLERRR